MKFLLNGLVYTGMRRVRGDGQEGDEKGKFKTGSFRKKENAS